VPLRTNAAAGDKVQRGGVDLTSAKTAAENGERMLESDRQLRLSSA
jgi:hypothetical protein